MSSVLVMPGGVQYHRRRPRLPNADEVRALAELLYHGGMQNKNCNSPAKVAARIIAGLELGLSPVQAVNWIAVINGRAVIWGDAALALVRASGKLESFAERLEGYGDERVAVCVSKRAGQPERETRFSVADAKTAKLWDKDGPWQEYPDRMLAMRARSWNLRDEFGDVLAGLGIAEEEQDVPVPAVKVTKVETNPPATASVLGPATATAAIEATPVCSAGTLTEIAQARAAWLDVLGIPPEHVDRVSKEWKAKLSEYGVESAKQMTQEAADRLLAQLRAAVAPPAEADPAADPFTGTPPGN